MELVVFAGREHPLNCVALLIINFVILLIVLSVLTKKVQACIERGIKYPAEKRGISNFAFSKIAVVSMLTKFKLNQQQ